MVNCSFFFSFRLTCFLRYLDPSTPNTNVSRSPCYLVMSERMLKGVEKVSRTISFKHHFVLHDFCTMQCFVLVIMPPSALDTLTRLNIVYPMLFKLTNKKTNRITHSGVLEFVADEGKVYLPYWVIFYS